MHFHCKNWPGWLAAITSWNFHFLLFSAPYLGPLECFILPCSGCSSKPGQVMTRQHHIKWLLMTCLTVTHREQMVQFCKAASEGLHQRDKEFLQMSLIFFGSKKGARLSFRPPGAFHHALWMAKVIYNIKIFMFHQQFSLTAKKNQSVKEMMLFVSVYIFGSGIKNLCLIEHYSMIYTIS